LLLVLAVSAGCAGGKSGSAETSAGAGNTSAGAGCSDSAYTEALSSRLVSLNKAVIGVDAGHGDIALLDAVAPGLVSAAGSVLATAQVTMPCRPELVRADTQLLAATKKLSLAGHTLTQMTAVAEKGEDYSGLESQFLSSYFSGTDGLQASLAALRSAGVPPLVKATGGRAIFLEAGCSSCHTLAAANAKGTAGPDLDDLRPSKTAVVSAVTDGQGVMLSFGGMLTADQIQAAAEFVSRSAGK
jgi:cytochrome c551/c552